MKNTFIYDKVNELILKELEQGNVPWRKPWTTDFPRNLISKQEYQGFNWWVLMIEQAVKNYKSNYWATFKQISSKGGKVKKGEKSTMVIYWTILEYQSKFKKDKNGKPAIDKIPLLKYYHVFNLDQTDVVLKEEDKIVQENLEANAIISKYQTQIKMTYKGNDAFYHPKDDYIQIPQRTQFKSDDLFYATNFHEMTHSTGHTTRLKRFENESYNHTFGSQDYSKEELIAEMGSSYLCAKTGILNNVIENKGAYIKSWLKVLKDDKTLLISASGKAQKAVDYILNI